MGPVFRAGMDVAVHAVGRDGHAFERLRREALFERFLERFHPKNAVGAGANGVFRVKSFEEALKKRFAAKSLEGMTIPANGMNSDIHASPEYRAHLVGVLARRAVAKATA